MPYSGPPPSLDLLLERDPSAPACTLQPLPPHPQQAPKPTQAPPVLLDVRAPPPDILPHPSGATVADLTRPEHQFDPHAWRPDVHQAVMDLPGLGNMGSTKQYWKHEVSQCFQPEGTVLPLSGSVHPSACVLKVSQGHKALQCHELLLCIISASSAAVQHVSSTQHSDAVFPLHAMKSGLTLGSALACLLIASGSTSSHAV